MCGFDSVQRGNYFGYELIRRTEVEERVGKAGSKDEVNGKGGWGATGGSVRV